MEKQDEIEELFRLGIDFFSKLSNLVSQYDVYFDYVNKANLATNDLLHKLELGKIEEGETKTKLFTQLTNIRKDRRFYKDKVESLESVITYYDNNKNVLNQLKNIIGTSNKKYNNRVYRKYKPRIFTDMKVN